MLADQHDQLFSQVGTGRHDKMDKHESVRVGLGAGQHGQAPIGVHRLSRGKAAPPYRDARPHWGRKWDEDRGKVGALANIEHLG